MSQSIELRAVIASRQGLSCLGYYTLANRTKHLRERLYVSVRDGDKLFLPRRREHFPVEEIDAYYLDQRGLAGRPAMRPFRSHRWRRRGGGG